MTSEAIIQRFNRGYEVVPWSGCWIWMGPFYSKHYGKISKGIYAHRFSWELHRGAVPIGAHVLHRCDIPECVNPAHLFLGSHAENMADMRRKWRHIYGERHWKARIGEQDVQDILAAHAAGTSRAELRRKYGFSEGGLRHVLMRRTWQYLSEKACINV